MSTPYRGQYKVVVLGLDGATFDLIEPWAAEGHLPHLASLLGRGGRSRLASTIPPITPCAWSSFMTGKNPGKHGLFDFVEPTSEGRGFRFTNASSRHGDSLWKILSGHGRRVGVLNVPMTYPPEPVDGYLVSGLDTPHPQSEYTYPRELKAELSQPAIGYRLEQQHLGNMRSDARRDQQLQEFRQIEDIRTTAFLRLEEKYPADFRMLVYGATDQVSHHFWHFMDEHHDKHDAAGAARYRHAIREIYQHVDTQLGRILDTLDDDTVVIVMSDHGFGPMSNVRLRLNQILEARGLLKFSSEGSVGRLRRLLGGLADRVLRSTLSADAKRWLAGRLPRLRVWFERLDEAGIDWSQTAAFTNEAYRSSPAVWLNRSRVPAEQREQMQAEIVALLTGLQDPQTGQPVISHVYQTANLYHGAYADRAPELLPSWWEDGFLVEQSVPAGPAGLQVERSQSPLAGGVEFAASHRIDGVFIGVGGPFKAATSFTGARIVDVAPTILHLMGLPIPDDMDGTVLTAALDPAYLQAFPPRTTGGGPVEPAAADVTGYSEEEEELVRERLQALGYIE